MAEYALKTNGLTKQYGNKTVLDRASISVERGAIYGLVGRNGAGKTTLMRLVTGQSLPSGGEIELLGKSGRELCGSRSRTGAMIEIPSFAPFLSAGENLEYYRLQRGIPGKGVVDEVLELVDLTQTGKKKFKAFSLGMKQRLGLALALMNHPDFLILDEPINGLDPEGVAEFRSILRRLNRERNTTILISSHILTELSNVATCYGFLDSGVLLEEVTAQALEEKCRACLEIRVDDPAKAALTLEETFHTKEYEVQPGGVIQLYACLDRPQQVAAALVAGGVALSGIEVRGADLEAYFLSLIGGVRHA